MSRGSLTLIQLKLRPIGMAADVLGELNRSKP